MKELQYIKPNDVKNLIQQLLSVSEFKSLPRLLLQRLRYYLARTDLHHTFVSTISKRIAEQEEPIRRIKCWILLHLLLSGATQC